MIKVYDLGAYHKFGCIQISLNTSSLEENAKSCFLPIDSYHVIWEDDTYAMSYMWTSVWEAGIKGRDK